MNLQDQPLLIFDGACGSNLQQVDLPASAWAQYEGCNEYLNLSAPEVIVGLHESFLEAGAMVLETNTFGANRIVLAEYGLESRVAEINRAAVENARRAIGTREAAWIAGSVGPTTKLPSLGHISPDDLRAALREQVRALVEAGVDALILETCQDLLQAKLAVIGAQEVLEELSRDLPLMVSITVENTGTMLVGAEVAAAAATLEPFGLFSLGLNCATGPDGMRSHLRYLSECWPGRISCIPNAGIPEVVGGKTVYPLTPAAYAAQMKAFVERDGVSVVGGCCGTTPEHIRALVVALGAGASTPASSAFVQAAERRPQWRPSLASAYQAVEIAQDIPPFVIGERANANGSKAFRELLLADDYEGCLKVGVSQEGEGAHAADLCTAYAGRDELADLTTLARMFAESVRAPLVIDSTTPDCIEACLKRYPGRCLINSINLEDGGANLERVCKLAKKYGAAVVALTINEKGMAMTTEEKVETAKAIHALAVDKYGLRPSDLLFDTLTFTIGSGDETLREAGLETLNAIRRVKEELPGCFTVLGVSNISFGLEARSRQILNSVFLHEAIEQGLDAAILHAGKVLPLSQIDERDHEVCHDVIYNVWKDPSRPPLTAFIEHFAGKQKNNATEEEADSAKLAEDALSERVVKGDKEGLEDLLSILLRRRTPVGIINQVLVPAMRHVGELFGRGEMLLPFVLQSAEVMKASVNYLEPYMDKAEIESSVKVLLATVQGDVHDIGKNLVDIILSNNGYKVFNLGIKVPAETILQKAREHEVDVIGLSGLLVKSALVMQQNLPQFREAGLTQPVLLGGAALTPKFVAESCVPRYGAPVVYCNDAFAGLRAMQEYEAGTLKPTTYDGTGLAAKLKPGMKNVEVVRDNPVPEPPFLGARQVTDLDPAVLFPYVNEQALFRGRWGYRRGKLSADEYRDLIAAKVRPLYEDLKRRCLDEQLVQPKVTYGYFRCHSEGDTLVVRDGDRSYAFGFPRQPEPPHFCIADFYKTQTEGGDVVGFFVVTIGDRISEATHELYQGDAYHDYLMLHALSVEVTDALAEYWHEVMRHELGIDAHRPADLLGYAVQDYQGSRYGFGYPSCPDLDAHKPVFDLLRPETIGVTLTENMEMVPEQTTSAIVAHHPQAKYFAV
ncbi:MAG: methionine synthase [Armatimonadetes bacterium CG_4_8_14_3_um_filter_66_20]|nr:MAG: methionine synthase [Armatimonadetes bacterium CG_4_8_14_3_um_filter_66_20]